VIRNLLTPRRDLPVIALCVVGAGLAVASGAIHLHLWNIYYRHETHGHLNVLFMVQTIACFVAGAAVLALRNILVAAGTAVLLIGTYVGYLITRYHGWFGFDPGSGIDTNWATWSMIVEIIGTVVLAVTAGLMARGGRGSATA
jgi:hypothetical protein